MPSEIPAKRLLVIDDSPEIGALVLDIAKPFGYSVEYVSAFAQFERALADQPDVIVVDLIMPDIDGVEVLRFLGERRCRAGILLLSMPIGALWAQSADRYCAAS